MSNNVPISNLTSATTPLDGTEVLPIVQGGTTKKVAVSNVGKTTLDSLDDVTITTPTSGQALLNDGLGGWANGDIPTTFAALTDTNITTPTNGQVPIYDDVTQKWVNGNIATSSNRNLLDNPWFTVNQRGFTSESGFTAAKYSVDRWRFGNANTQANLSFSNNVMTIENNSSLYGAPIEQLLENALFSDILGEKITLSAKMSNGVIHSLTVDLPSSIPVSDTSLGSEEFNDGLKLLVNMDGSNVKVTFSATAGNTISVKAVKLELGSTSTLALDTAPNYTEELLKCQKYLKVFSAGANNTPFGLAQSKGTTEARMVFITEIPMRITPTLSTSGTFIIVKADGTEPAVTNVAYTGTEQIMSFTFTTTGLTSGECVRVAMQSGTKIILSAEL